MDALILSDPHSYACKILVHLTVYFKNGCPNGLHEFSAQSRKRRNNDKNYFAKVEKVADRFFDVFTSKAKENSK